MSFPQYIQKRNLPPLLLEEHIMRNFERKYRDQTGVQSHNLRRNASTRNTLSLELVEVARRRVRSLRQRRHLRQLLSYNDHALADMGHSRDRLLRDLRLPMNANAAPEVQNIHLQNMHPDQPRAHH